jgi:hypothetical protein
LNDFASLDSLDGRNASRKVLAQVIQTIGRKLEYHVARPGVLNVSIAKLQNCPQSSKLLKAISTSI